MVELREITAMDKVWTTDIAFIPAERVPIPGGDRGSVLQELAQLEALEQS